MAKDKEINVEINESGERINEEPTPDSEARVSEEATQDSEETNSEAEAPSTEARLAMAEDKLLRTMAEFDNYRKRTAMRLDDMIQSANEKLLLEILEIVDNFERALQHSDDNGITNAESLRKGTELIYNQMQAVLKKYDVVATDSLGKPFDPNVHDAMMQTPSEEYDDGVVAMVISKGYRIGDRILRHAKVAVSTGAPQTEEQNPEAEV